MAKLKVYGWMGFYPRAMTDRTKNCSYVMSAVAKADVLRAVGKKAWDHYPVMLTYNEHAMAVALAKPHAVFVKDEIYHTPGEHVYVEVSPKDVR